MPRNTHTWPDGSVHDVPYIHPVDAAGLAMLPSSLAKSGMRAAKPVAKKAVKKAVPFLRRAGRAVKKAGKFVADTTKDYVRNYPLIESGWETVGDAAGRAIDKLDKWAGYEDEEEDDDDEGYVDEYGRRHRKGEDPNLLSRGGRVDMSKLKFL